jgi:hypothetical protein
MNGIIYLHHVRTIRAFQLCPLSMLLRPRPIRLGACIVGIPSLAGGRMQRFVDRGARFDGKPIPDGHAGATVVGAGHYSNDPVNLHHVRTIRAFQLCPLSMLLRPRPIRLGACIVGIPSLAGGRMQKVLCFGKFTNKCVGS